MSRRTTRHSVVITDTDFLLEAGRMMSSLSESALPAGFFSLLSSDPGDSDLNQDLDALSLEIRTDWCRGRLSRSLIFEVTQRVRDHRASDLIGCDDDGGISCCDSVEEFIDGLLREVVDTAVETAEADQRDRILCGLLGPYACAPLLDRQEIQQIGNCLVSTHSSLVSGAQRMQAAWRMILVSSAMQLMISFRRILCRQSFRLAAELEPLDATSERHLLTDPRHGLLAILLERRRLLRAGQSTQSCSELSNSAYSPGSLAILTDSSSLVSEAPGDLTSMVKNVPVRRRHASDPGPTMDHHAADTPADRLVRAIARETLVELRSVSDQILELTVVYLKNAALDVIDSSVDEVKTVLSTRL